MLTFVKAVLAFVPIALMAVKQTTTIRASMTAYSTAVGPSSRLMKFTSIFVAVRMLSSSSGSEGREAPDETV